MIRVSGPPGNLMIVGDYPTANELATGVAFSGSVGSCISRCFAPFKKTLNDIYCTYLIKTAVPGYGSPNKKKSEEAWTAAWQNKDWAGMLKGEIDAVMPNVIFCFGEKPFQFLTGESKSNAHRGSILNLRNDLNHFREESFCPKVMPLTEPREIMAENFKPTVYTIWDIAKALKYEKVRARFVETGLVWIVRKPSELENWWSRARDGQFLTFDIETHNGFITCIGFSHNGEEAISVPLINSGMSYHDLGLTYSIVDRILRSPILKVNQNIKYDLTVLENFGFKINNVHDDTMLLAHSIYPELPKGLDFLNSIYTEIPYYKDEGKNYDPKQHSYDQLLRYNAKDALSTWIVYKEQIEDAKKNKVWFFHREKVWPCFAIYKKSDERGFRLDETARVKLKKRYRDALLEVAFPLKAIAKSQKFNLESPLQVGRFLYETLSIKTRMHKTPSGNSAYSTDRKTLESLLIKGEDKLTDGRSFLIRSILLGRQLGTVLGFLEALPSLDGRFRQNSKITGTETGRTSASKPIERIPIFNGKTKIEMEECGWSFQTIGKHPFLGLDGEIYGSDLRSIFVPSDGFVFVGGDQSQAEARVVSVLARDELTLRMFDELDIHKFTASLILGKPMEEITKAERQFVGKTGRHAGNYNESPGGLMLRTNRPIAECRNIINKFHESVPLVRQNFHQGIRDLISRQRYLVSPSGRRRDFFGMVNEDMFKEGFATIPQATVSDHTKHTIMRIMNDKYANRDCHLLSEAHDGVLYEVPKALKDSFAEDLSNAIRVPISFKECSMSSEWELVIPGEVKIMEDCWVESK